MATKLQIRRDTASNWTSANPTLSAGEFGYETDTNKLKIGNGSTAWTSLDYFVGDINTYLAGGNVQHIIPAGNELYDLGDSDSRFRDLYLSGSTIRLGSVTLSVDSSNALVLPSGTKLGSVNVLDSAGVQSVIDQTYIRNNQIKYSTAQFTDSAFVTTQINNLIDGAPGTLNTLNEIAAALNDDDSAYGTLLALINAKTNYDSADTLGLIDSAYVQARQTSGGSGTVDSDQVISIINNNTNSGFAKYRYTATAGQTVFQDSDASGNILSFDPNSTIVFYNGVMLDETTDYTASNNAITLTSGADAGVSLSVVKFGVGYGGPTFTWGGDRGIMMGGNGQLDIDYWSIATPGNASLFGVISSSSQGYSFGSSCGDGTKVCNAATGAPSSPVNTILYVTASSTGNASDFGDLTQARLQAGSLGDGTYGYWMGGTTNYSNGSSSAVNVIDYVTLATTGNASDFGDLLEARMDTQSTGTNGSIGLIAGGQISGSSYTNTIQSFTTGTPGNASDFGDLTATKRGSSGTSDTTRFCNIGGIGDGTGTSNVIDYVTMASSGNAQDFGDLNRAASVGGACSDGTYATHAGGNPTAARAEIQYFTIQTLGNASDFGDLQDNHYNADCWSGSSS